MAGHGDLVPSLSSQDRGVQTRPSLAIFDLDGTLVDSQEGILYSFRATLDELGITGSDDQLKGMIGPPLNESFEKLGFAGEELQNVLDRYRDFYGANGLGMSQLYDGIDEMLRRLRADGVRLAVATAKRVDFAREMLQLLGIADYFEVVQGASESGEITSKNEIVAKVLDHFESPDPHAVWMVGDRQYDVHAALFHDLVPVGVLWGYGSREELLSSGAQIVVSHPREIVSREEEFGGDPVCWVQYVCPNCGAMEGGPHRLASCATLAREQD